MHLLQLNSSICVSCLLQVTIYLLSFMHRQYCNILNKIDFDELNKLEYLNFIEKQCEFECKKRGVRDIVIICRDICEVWEWQGQPK